MHFLDYNSEVDLLTQTDCTCLITFQSDFIRLLAQDCVREFDVAKYDILLSGSFFWIEISGPKKSSWTSERKELDQPQKAETYRIHQDLPWVKAARTTCRKEAGCTGEWFSQWSCQESLRALKGYSFLEPETHPCGADSSKMQLLFRLSWSCRESLSATQVSSLVPRGAIIIICGGFPAQSEWTWVLHFT